MKNVEDALKNRPIYMEHSQTTSQISEIQTIRELESVCETV